MKLFRNYFFCISLAMFSAEIFVRAADNADPRVNRHFLYLGGDAGLSYLSSGVTTELDKTGYDLDAKALYSYAWKKFAFDAGFGWVYNRDSGDSSGRPLIYERVTTKSPFAEFAPRYRFLGNFEAGPMTDILFGRDSSFGTTGTKQSINTFVGLQALYSFPFKYPLRIVLEVMKDVNLKDRDLFLVVGGLQIGIPVSSNESVEKNIEETKREIQSPSPAASPAATPSVSPSPKPSPQVLVKLDSELILFETNSAKLSERSNKFLTKLGNYLAHSSISWEQLDVEGHTDQRGSANYNLKLSQDRADSVKAALVEGGADGSRIHAIGYGLTRLKNPANTPSAWRDNRRVEFGFDKVKDSFDIQQAISRIKKELRMAK